MSVILIYLFTPSNSFAAAFSPYSKEIAIFKSANMSFDINLMKNIVSQVALALKDNIRWRNSGQTTIYHQHFL